MLIIGFLFVIVLIIVVIKFFKRYFFRRILIIERNIDFFVVECIMCEDRVLLCESVVNYVLCVCYEILYLDI